jgi:hypothetical protein
MYTGVRVRIVNYIFHVAMVLVHPTLILPDPDSQFAKRSQRLPGSPQVGPVFSMGRLEVLRGEAGDLSILDSWENFHIPAPAGKL